MKLSPNVVLYACIKKFPESQILILCQLHFVSLHKLSSTAVGPLLWSSRQMVSCKVWAVCCDRFPSTVFMNCLSLLDTHLKKTEIEVLIIIFLWPNLRLIRRLTFKINFYYSTLLLTKRRRNSSVSIVPTSWRSGVLFPVGAGNFIFATASMGHPAFCPMATAGSFLEGKPAASRNWPLTSM